MAFGTAGLTAGLCLRKLLQHGLKPDDGKVFVTGVTGGVGIISLMLLSKLGFEVDAITGKMNEKDLLIDLGANEVIDRNDLDVDLVSPLQKPIYSGGIDAVGGKIEIILDGGIRRGTHVLKALSLGATACSFGKGFLFALGAGGQKGVEQILSKMKDEIRRDMILLGCKSIKELNKTKIAYR